MNKNIGIILLLLIFSNCNSQNNDFNLDQSAIQIRQFQKRSYSNIDYLKLMKSIAANLQDMGLYIKNVDTNLGIIYGEMQITPKTNTLGHVANTFLRIFMIVPKLIIGKLRLMLTIL